MRYCIALLIFLLTINPVSAAEQCSAVFPDGASTHSTAGTISFGSNSQLIGSDDNLLATTAVSKNDGSRINTCNTADCVATGMPSNAASSAISFQTTASTVDVPVGYQNTVEVGSGSFSGNEFDEINPSSGSEAVITFSATNNEYFVNSLRLGSKNILYLQAGATYWFNQLTLGSEVNVIVQGSGTALIYVKQNLRFPSPGLINSPSNNNSGDASKLVLYAFSEVNFSDKSTYTGSLYAQGNITLGATSYAFGAISAANIQLNDRSTITYQSAEVADTDFGNLCEPPPPLCTVTAGVINAVGIKIDNGGSDFQINTTTEALAIHAAWLAAGSPVSGLISSGTYNVAASGSSEVDRIDFGGSEHDFIGTLSYPGAADGVGDEDFLVHSSGTLSLPAGTYTIFVESDDGFSFVMETLSGDTVSFNKFGSSSSGGSNELRFENPTGNSNTGGSFTLSQNSVFDISAIFFERGGGDYLEISIANGINTSAAPTGYEILREGALSDKVRFGRCPKSIVLDYHFDKLSWEGTPNEVLDNTSFNNHGTAQGALNTGNNAPAISGPIGTCSYGEFDGVDDYVAMGNPDSLNFTGEITLAAWIRPDGTSEHMNIIAHGMHVDPNQEIIFRIRDGNYQVGVWDGSDHLASSVIPAGDLGSGNWVHLAGTYDGTIWRLYRNGVELSSATDPKGALLVSADWAIGANGSGSDSFFKGGIDEPRIYSEALTASDISDLMNETRTCPHPPAPLCGVDGNSLYAIGIKINNAGSDAQINTTTEALAIHAAWVAAGSPVSGLINDGTYNVAASGVSQVDRIDFGGSEQDFTGTLAYPGANAGVGDTDFLVHTSGTLSLPAGDYTVFVESDDGFSFVMDSLSGDTVSFNKFGSSSSGESNELRFENPTSNSNTGGSFTLSKNSVFDVAAIFYERGGGDYLEISIANDIRTNAAPTGYEVLRHGALDDKVKFGQCPGTFQVDHYRIENDGQGFTCEAKALTIKACADETCDTPYTEETSITLSPSSWEGGNTFVFTGETTANLKVTDEGTITLAKTAAIPDANLRCFNGATETCDIRFSNDGFQIYDANGETLLQDQLAGSNFVNVNLRAIRGVDGVCAPLLEGEHSISIGYKCDEPNVCLRPLSDISVETAADIDGYRFGLIKAVFDEAGVASLTSLNYPDAGVIKLSAKAEIEGVTFDISNKPAVEVYPSYLALSVEETELVYGEPDINEQNNYVAGESFTFILGAYGVNNELLPNYQAKSPQLKVTRVSPTDAGKNGYFKYSGSSPIISAGVYAAVTDISSDSDSFSDGEYRYNDSFYTEVGRIEIDAKDANYLGNEIGSNEVLILGNFYPAFFKAEASKTPTLADTCGATFSYLGQNISFETPPEITITAYNALGEITQNYSDDYWNYLPDKATLDATLSYLDSSTYADDVSDSASVIDRGDAPVLTQNDNYDGTGVITINNGRFRYNKVNPIDSSVYTSTDPFAGSINLELTSDFFRNTFTDQNGAVQTICYQASHLDSTCLELNINEVVGTQIRYGRLVLESVFGPETESLRVPLKVEYFANNQWLLNLDDFCTNITFTEESAQIQLTENSLAEAIDLVSSAINITSGENVMQGESGDDDFILSAPGTGMTGELDIWLDPTNVDVTWPTYLNYDWNGDGIINTDDFPKATATFGLFRGNDRIIHWREVFN